MIVWCLLVKVINRVRVLLIFGLVLISSGIFLVIFVVLIIGKGFLYFVMINIRWGLMFCQVVVQCIVELIQCCIMVLVIVGVLVSRCLVSVCMLGSRLVFCVRLVMWNVVRLVCWVLSSLLGLCSFRFFLVIRKLLLVWCMVFSCVCVMFDSGVWYSSM